MSTVTQSRQLLQISDFASQVLEYTATDGHLFTVGDPIDFRTSEMANILATPAGTDSLLKGGLFSDNNRSDSIWRPLTQTPEVRFAQAAVDAAKKESDEISARHDQAGLKIELRELAHISELDALAHFATGYVTRMIFSAFQAAAFAMLSQKKLEPLVSCQRDTSIRTLYLLKDVNPIIGALALEEAFMAIEYYRTDFAEVGNIKWRTAPQATIFPSGIDFMMQLIETSRQGPFNSCLKDYVLDAFPQRTDKSKKDMINLIRGQMPQWKERDSNKLNFENSDGDFSQLILEKAIEAWTFASEQETATAVLALTRGFQLALHASDPAIRQKAAESVIDAHTNGSRAQTLARVAVLKNASKLPPNFALKLLREIACTPDFVYADDARDLSPVRKFTCLPERE